MPQTDYDLGYDAYHEGQPFNLNKSKEWQRGWSDAKETDPELIVE